MFSVVENNKQYHVAQKENVLLKGTVSASKSNFVSI